MANTPNHYEMALKATLAERQTHGDELSRARQHVFELEERDRSLVGLARRLLKEMPADRQAGYLHHFPWLSEGPDPASRQAVLFGIIHAFMANPGREFTPPDIERSLESQGIHANPKRIYNTLNYLAAEGRLIRSGRGRYIASPSIATTKAADEVA
jgi:hypothetical protein